MKQIQKNEGSVRRKIIVFGGSFSPPTLAHEAIIRACLALSGFDAVWVMPSGDRRDKSMTASDTDRLAMLGLMKRGRFHSDPRLIISDFELRLQRPTATYQTVAALQQAYPEAVFWFALGADSYESMITPAWEHGEELRQSLNIIVVGRIGMTLPGRRGLLALPVDTHEGISSTVARARISSRRSAKGIVSEPVHRYIREHYLYRS